ncbi:MAG: nucleotidyltransferase domain-containing protein [Lentimicrobium sp.]|jgi:predicted nucleotidyltransferase|nr:nucleotidyltransferase domain-containing protein [Lentimicrobium sp.]
MDQETIKEVIVFLKQCLIKNGIQIDAIALFGSALHGDMNKGSDIDLIIISSGFSNLDIFERARLTMKSETETLRKFKIPMDILNLSPEEYEHSNARLFYQSKIVA